MNCNQTPKNRNYVKIVERKSQERICQNGEKSRCRGQEIVLTNAAQLRMEGIITIVLSSGDSKEKC